VCGCNGKTYADDCDRLAAGVQKATNGSCGVCSEAAYLVWQAPGAISGTTQGPTVAVCGSGWAETWDRTGSWSIGGASPERPPSGYLGNYDLATAQTADLFARLSAVNLASLPHATSTVATCEPYLYLRICAGCSPQTLSYTVASQLVPEMEQVWLWFDQIVGRTSATNPRNYCAF
jgi:hypothetical protein